jgi:hypothetical protein
LLAPRFVALCVAIVAGIFSLSSCIYVNDSPSMATGVYIVGPFTRMGAVTSSSRAHPPPSPRGPRRVRFWVGAGVRAHRPSSNA